MELVCFSGSLISSFLTIEEFICYILLLEEAFLQFFRKETIV